jgi:hypothetical protein
LCAQSFWGFDFFCFFRWGDFLWLFSRGGVIWKFICQFNGRFIKFGTCFDPPEYIEFDGESIKKNPRLGAWPKQRNSLVSLASSQPHNKNRTISFLIFIFYRFYLFFTVHYFILQISAVVAIFLIECFFW